MTTKTQQQSELPFDVTDTFYQLASVWQDYRIIILQGGTWSSKTMSVMQKLILQAMHNRYTITVTGQDLPNLRSGPLRDMDFILDNSKPEVKQSLAKPFNKSLMTYTFKSGSVIEFKSFKDAQDAKSGKRDICFINEANGVSKQIYDELAIRTKIKVILDFNATAKFWAHDLPSQHSDAILFITNYTHNKFVTKEIKREILSYKYTNPHRWRVYGIGLTGSVEGAIYTNWEFIHPDKLPPWEDMDYVGCGLDYGYANDPLAFSKNGLYKGTIYSALYLYDNRLKLREDIVAVLEEHAWDYDIAMDESNAKEQADILTEDYGFMINIANRKAGAISRGVSLIQEYPVKVVDYTSGFYERGVSNAVVEYENYKWKNIRGAIEPLPVDKFNHYMDSVRYWALDNLIHLHEPDNDQGPIQKLELI